MCATTEYVSGKDLHISLVLALRFGYNNPDQFYQLVHANGLCALSIKVHSPIPKNHVRDEGHRPKCLKEIRGEFPPSRRYIPNSSHFYECWRYDGRRSCL